MFQRSANAHAGLWIEGPGIATDASWKCITAPEFLAHDKQAVGVIGHARIRYPQVLDGGARLPGDIHSPSFDDSSWKSAAVVTGGPWPARPADVETPGQREYPVRPVSVLAAGTSVPGGALRNDPLSMASDMRKAALTPDAEAAARASALIGGGRLVIEGKAGTARYVTFDFGMPVHGYPYLRIADATPGAAVDFGYCEIPYSLRDGAAHVRADGWINTEGVVGPGYGDRYVTSSGGQYVELPDERTARWMALHIRFPKDGRVVIEDTGMVRSQFPVRMIGSFSCGDERVDRIVKLCLIHAEVTMSDAYVDTPDVRTASGSRTPSPARSSARAGSATQASGASSSAPSRRDRGPTATFTRSRRATSRPIPPHSTGASSGWPPSMTSTAGPEKPTSSRHTGPPL